MLLLNRKYDNSIEKELGNFRYGHGSRQLNINRGRFAACEKKKKKKKKDRNDVYSRASIARAFPSRRTYRGLSKYCDRRKKKEKFRGERASYRPRGKHYSRASAIPICANRLHGQNFYFFNVSLVTYPRRLFSCSLKYKAILIRAIF